MTLGTIRPAASDDAVHLARILRAARAAAMPWLPVLHTPEQDEAYFAETILPSQTVHICACDGAAIGFIAFGVNWVNHLYIAPRYWGQGHGAALLDLAKAASTHLQLWAFQGNTLARRFYARHGFSEVLFTDGQHNEERTPDVRLEWRR